MSEFDEWFKNRHTKTGLYEEALCGKDDATYIRHEMRKAYLAGQQSQQAKIDEALIEMKNQLGDEDFCDMQRPDYDAMLYALRNIKDILKGNKDEN